MVEMLKVLSSTTITIIPEKDIEAVAERRFVGRGTQSILQVCFPEFGLVKGSMLSNIQYTWKRKSQSSNQFKTHSKQQSHHPHQQHHLHQQHHQ